MMRRDERGTHRDGRRRLLALVVFASAMGWLEAVVVVYIRELLGLRMTTVYPAPQEMLRRLGELKWLLPTEQGREVATIVMLMAVAWLAGWTSRSRLGAFLVCFGVWDIAYYVALRFLVGWPRSLMDMDLLFLIPPHPWWYQPVWVPVAISCVMISAGLSMQRDKRRH